MRHKHVIQDGDSLAETTEKRVVSGLPMQPRESLRLATLFAYLLGMGGSTNWR